MPIMYNTSRLTMKGCKTVCAFRRYLEGDDTETQGCTELDEPDNNHNEEHCAENYGDNCYEHCAEDYREDCYAEESHEEDGYNEGGW